MLGVAARLSRRALSVRRAPGVFHQHCITGDYVGSFGSRGFSSFASGFEPLKHKPLESIIDVQRAKLQTPEDLATIWDDFHIGRGHIGASMKTKLYHLLEQRAADCRYFSLPVWKGSGYTTMFMQGSADATHTFHWS